MKDCITLEGKRRSGYFQGSSIFDDEAWGDLGFGTRHVQISGVYCRGAEQCGGPHVRA